MTKNLNWEISTKNLVTFKRWDGVNDKKFNNMGVHWKIQGFFGGLHKKKFLGEGMNCLKKGAWIVCRFKSGIGKKRGHVLRWGGADTLMHTDLEESSYWDKYPKQMTL